MKWLNHQTRYRILKENMRLCLQSQCPHFDWGTCKKPKCSLRKERKTKETENKYDQEKPMLNLVPPTIIEAIGWIRTYGQKKYGSPDGWKKVEPERYIAALMRHLCAFLRNPKGKDAESGYPHLWHLACNVAFLCEFYNEEEK